MAIFAAAIAVSGVAAPFAWSSGTPPVNLVPPAISGTPAVGLPLTTSTGVWTGTQPITYVYQWLRCKPGGSCSAILGATKATYLVGPADVGDTIVSTVTAVNLYGRAVAKSAPTAVVGGGGHVVTGASLATCSTSPCRSGSLPTGSGTGCAKGTFGTNMVGLGSISNGKASECRLYGYYKPSNISGAAAAVFVASGANGLCGAADVSQVLKDSRWQSVADGNRLVLILLSKAGSPTCRSHWYQPNVDVPAPPVGSPSDQPYLRAVVKDATSRLGLDSQRLYLTGASSGGDFVFDTACDPVTSLQFRGFAVISQLMQAKIQGSTFAPNSERCGVPGGAPTTNQDFFIENVHGTNDGIIYFGGKCYPSENHCRVPFSENARWWAQHMGCAATPVVTMFGSPSALNEKDDYQNCTFGSPAVSYESVKVTNGCHAWSGLDAQPAFPSSCSGSPKTNNTNGFYTAQTDWNWFSTRAWLG